MTSIYKAQRLLTCSFFEDKHDPQQTYRKSQTWKHDHKARVTPPTTVSLALFFRICFSAYQHDPCCEGFFRCSSAYQYESTKDKVRPCTLNSEAAAFMPTLHFSWSAPIRSYASDTFPAPQGLVEDKPTPIISFKKETAHCTLRCKSFPKPSKNIQKHDFTSHRLYQWLLAAASMLGACVPCSVLMFPRLLMRNTSNMQRSEGLVVKHHLQNKPNLPQRTRQTPHHSIWPL